MLNIHIRFDNDSQSSSRTSTSSHSHAGVIAGGVIGTSTGLALICFGLGYFLSRRRNNIRSSEGIITSYIIPPRPDHNLHGTAERSMVTLTGKAALPWAEPDRLEHSTGGQSIATPTPPPTSMAVPVTSATGGGGTESELAYQIAELRMEVADLRMRPSIVDVLDDFPPPQYDNHGSDMR